jgi:hypothetical protein
LEQTLSGVYRLSKRQVVGLCDGLLGLRIATGTVAKLQRRAGEILAAPADAIDAAVRTAGAVHVDETGWREAGRKAWLWAAVADVATSFRIDRSRGHDGLRALLGGRVIISDRFPTYARAPNRQLCWAHLRRDFQAMIDRGSGGEVIGERLLAPLKWVFVWVGSTGVGDALTADVADVRRGAEGLRTPPVEPGGVVLLGRRVCSGCPCRRTSAPGACLSTGCRSVERRRGTTTSGPSS